MEINNNNPCGGINYQLANSIKKNNNEKKLNDLYKEKAKYENQAWAWNDIRNSLNNLRFAAIKLESVTKASVRPTLLDIADAYNQFRDTWYEHANGALRSSDMLSKIEFQLQEPITKLRSLGDSTRLEKGKLVIDGEKLDKVVSDNPEAIINFLKGEGTDPGANKSFKTNLYQALDNALRPGGLPGIIDGLIAGAMCTIKNALKHIDRNIQLAGNRITAQQKITGSGQAYHQIQNEIQKIHLDIIHTFSDKK